ncbi:mitochondrial carrier domain-containing protein [Pelagophyceae sp. CCMP2097]|nr:mitochondrial carrier domain-containing protein [Pelagophyceae sp. CCMP2097]|mmetsp:Transcript_25302/g.86783  ORF Transcript_25302/g.86783 Transcript_25302/m.86783 type:complete len:283 (+) Transcript_25302:61-909(+)
MAHTERRASPMREGQLAVVGGAIYGASHTISGHPLDNVKAALQLEPKYRGLSAVGCAKALWRDVGWRGFTRGVGGPLWGSAVYRSVMMSSYEFSFTALGAVDKASPWGGVLHAEVLGVRPLVVAAVVFSSLCRATLESPFEYAKVMAQTGRGWVFRDVYRGVAMQTVRTTVMLTFIFVPYDIAARKTTWMQHIGSQWLFVSGVCAAAYAAAWPFETLKNLAQAARPFPNATIAERINYLGGPRGLYLGVWPGTLCGGFRNGVAMVAMANYQRLCTEHGLRDE